MHPRSTIERYVADGLPGAEEREVRTHLKQCDACRAYYDEQRVLFRALAGDANKPTPDELRSHSALAARSVFAQPSATDAAKAKGFGALLDRLLWAPSRTWALGAGAAGAAVAAVILFVVVGPSRGLEGEMPLAAVVTKTKDVALAGNLVEEQAELRALQIVDVPKGGMLELALVRGGVLRVFPETRFALGARGESVVLERGKVWCLPEEGRGGFEVTTATATVRVLGTSFIVDADEEKTDVRVVSGSVEVMDSEEHGRVRLQKAESTRVERGQSPSSPRRASTANDAREWQGFLNQVIKSIDQGVRAIQRELQKGGGR